MRAPFGQNFLADAGTARRIVNALGPAPDLPVIEVGPGRGALTDILVHTGAMLTAVELDRHLAEQLSARYAGLPHVRVVTADFLTWPLPEGNGYRLIGNLPYSAGAAILQKVLAWDGWARGVFMLQKEVADRLVALPGERSWGLLGLSVHIRARARRLFAVPPGAFRPRPAVRSTVVELTPLSTPAVRHVEGVFRLARAAFHQRRKMIANSLAHGLPMDKAVVTAHLQSLGIDPARRPETITPAEFDRLCGCIGGVP